MKTTNTDFLGCGWSFPPSFEDEEHHIQMVKGEQDIRQSLSILLSTAPGERLMHPDFGCDLHTLVFDSMSQTLVSEIKDVVRRAILFFEPRINLIDLHVETTPEHYLEGRILIELSYMIRSTNTRSNMVYPFYFIEGTDL